MNQTQENPLSQISTQRFSQLSEEEKKNFLLGRHFDSSKIEHYKELLSDFSSAHHKYPILQEMSENTLSHFPLPFGIVPNVLINKNLFDVPMVIEESSVVAAASKSAKLWKEFAGIKAQTLCQEKMGHIHFFWFSQSTLLFSWFETIGRKYLQEKLAPLETNMKKRGGGILSLTLKNCTEKLAHYYQLEIVALTGEAMGANFLNTLLEAASQILKDKAPSEGNIDILMSILSNYTPNCRVKASVVAPVKELDLFFQQTTQTANFCQRFLSAIKISKVSLERAVTHNKGIFNGIDGVILATGNDFRAIEACGHAYAGRLGSYQGLSEAYLEMGHENNSLFHFSLELPMAVGVVGGLTRLHPLANFSLELLKNPSSNQLMEIACSIGLLQNFAAVSSLVTTGIQKGHMRMHLLNILKHLEATKEEKANAVDFFKDKTISFTAVCEFLESLRRVH